MYELIFEKEGKLYASPSDYEKCIINIKHQLLGLNLMVKLMINFI